MAIASYPYSINKRLPLDPLARLAAVAVIPDLARMPANHWLILHCIKPLIYLKNPAIKAHPDGPSPWSRRHLSGQE
jgi:hypothetical protein